MTLGPDLLDYADELVADAVRLGGGDDPAVWPQVGAADTGGDDANDRVAPGGEDRVGNFLDADVPFAVDDSRKHAPSLRCEATPQAPASPVRGTGGCRRVNRP